MLLVHPEGFSESALTWLSSVDIPKAVAVGDANSVPDAVLKSLSDTGIPAERLGGDDQYSTAAVVAAELGRPGRLPGLGRTAIVASGEAFADGLAAGPLAAIGRHPILLTSQEELAAPTRVFLADAARSVDHVVLMGGAVAIGKEAERDIESLGVEVTRLAGATRYETAQIAARLLDRTHGHRNRGTCTPRGAVGLATGHVPFDSLSAAPFLAELCAPLLLTQSDSLVDAAVQRLQCYPAASIHVFGGTAAVTASVAESALSSVPDGRPGSVVARCGGGLGGGNGTGGGDGGAGSSGGGSGADGGAGPIASSGGGGGGGADDSGGERPDSRGSGGIGGDDDSGAGNGIDGDGRIAFVVHGGPANIFLIDADGGNPRQLTAHDNDTGAPNWSPDGAEIAYSVAVDGGVAILAAAADGTGARNLTDGSRTDRNPAWSPDGTKLLYDSADGWDPYLYSVRSDGTDAAALTSFHAREPQWSPDGSKIMYVASNGTDSDVFVMNADGTNHVELSRNATNDSDAVWSPDSTKAAFVNRFQIYVAPVDGGAATNLGSGKEPAWSPDGAKIAFLRAVGTQYEVYVMNADGSDPTRLTTNQRPDSRPTWSPDGSKIAYLTSTEDGSYEIVVMNADGTDSRQLTDNEHDDGDDGSVLLRSRDRVGDFAWSPDSTTIAFNSKPIDAEIGVMSADGSGVVQLTDNGRDDESPVWSPDGERIAFVFDDGDAEIGVMSADGSGVVQLTDNGRDDESPVWSPDGERIAFVFDDGDAEIGVMSADGSGVVQLTDNGRDDESPVWSPDGTRIYYVTDDGDSEIAVINADGTEYEQLTDNDWPDQQPAVSPDGTQIAYTAIATVGDVEIYRMSADGTGITALTSGGAHSLEPVWSPDGSHIAYIERLLWFRTVEVMAADGSNQTSLTFGADPAWSPDGEWIAFASGGILIAARPDGSGKRRLIGSSGTMYSAPAWQP